MIKKQNKKYWTIIQMSDGSCFYKRSSWNGKKTILNKDPNNHKDWLKKTLISLERNQTDLFSKNYVKNKNTPMVKR